MKKIKNVILSKLILINVLAMTNICHANDLTKALNATEDIEMPETMEKGQNLVLNAADWVMLFGISCSVLVLVAIGVMSIFKSENQHDFKALKSWAIKILIILSVVLGVKKIVEFVIIFFTT